MGRSLAPRVYLFFIITAFERVVDGTLHNLLQLNVRLGPGHDFTHPIDVMLQQMFV